MGDRRRSEILNRMVKKGLTKKISVGRADPVA